MIQYESELLHHGVKGMKWGVRRYENPDGSLTAEGKKHVKTYKTYSKLGKKNADINEKFYNSTDDRYLSAVKKSDKEFRSFKKANRKGVKIGRKLAARHGNKGAIAEKSLSSMRKWKALSTAEAIGAGVELIRANRARKLSQLTGVSQGQGKKFVNAIMFGISSYMSNSIGNDYRRKAQKNAKPTKEYRDIFMKKH